MNFLRKLTEIIVLVIVLIPLWTRFCHANWEMMAISKDGSCGSIAINSLSGTPHVTYIDDSKSRSDLQYGYFDGKRWHQRVLDPRGTYPIGITVDRVGHVHISFVSGLSGLLMYVHYDGSEWQSMGIEFNGWQPSIGVDSQNLPHISYIVSVFGEPVKLKYAKYDGSSWIIETVTLNAASLWSTSLALTSSDKAHISYCGYNGNDWVRRIYSATNATGDWVVSYVGDGIQSSLAVDSSGNPHIAYSNELDVKYAKHNGTEWSTQMVENGGQRPSIALDRFDQPHISYGWRPPSSPPEGIYVLKYAHPEGGNWELELIDPEETGCPSIVVDQLGFPHISYVENQGDRVVPKYANFGMPELGGTWKSVETNAHELKGVFDLQNMGTRKSDKFSTAFYLSDDDVFDAGDKLVGKRDFSLKPRQSKIILFSYRSEELLSGKYLISVIDSEGRVNEVDENNNVVSAEIP